MKKFITLILLLLLPTLLLELFLQTNNASYRKIILYNSDFSEWQQAAPRMNSWKETIIMGSSIAKQDIDPEVIQKQLEKRGIKTQVGNIANNASSTTNDYLTLKRILATCRECPKRIIYQPTDVSLKNHEISIWKDTTLRRILKLYFPDQEFEALLKIASKSDPYFKEYLLDFKIYRIFRIPFTKGRLVSIATNEIYKKFGFTSQDNYQPNYSDHHLVNDGNGFYAYPKKMDKQMKMASLKHEKDVLANYATGNPTELFFLSFLDLAKKHHIKIYFVLTPENKLHLQTFVKEEKIFTTLVTKTATHYKIPVINDQNFMSESDELFYDLKHLNAKGANIYSRYLGAELAKVWR